MARESPGNPCQQHDLMMMYLLQRGTPPSQKKEGRDFNAELYQMVRLKFPFLTITHWSTLTQSDNFFLLLFNINKAFEIALVVWRLSSLKMNTEVRVQALFALLIALIPLNPTLSHSTYTFGKGMNPTISHSIYTLGRELNQTILPPAIGT